MGIWGWVQTIGAIWLAVSIVGAVLWGLAGRRIFRTPPKQPTITVEAHDATVNDVIAELNRRNHLNGGV